MDANRSAKHPRHSYGAILPDYLHVGDRYSDATAEPDDGADHRDADNADGDPYPDRERDRDEADPHPRRRLARHRRGA